MITRHITALIITIVMVAGILLSGLSAWSLHKVEERAIINDFEKDVDGRASALYRALTVNLETLHSLSVMFSGDTIPTFSRFSSEAKKILSRHNDIQALEWIPRVSNNERALYETGNRQYFPDFQFTQRESQGQMITAGDRAEYFPVYYVEPIKGNEAAIGFDLASNPRRRETLEKSRNGGKYLATASINLVQETAIQKGFLAFLPLYTGDPLTEKDRRENLRGFVLGVFRISDMFNNSVLSEKPLGIDMILMDETSGGRQDILLVHQSRTGIETVEHISYKKELPDIWGRKWSIIAKPTLDYVSIRQSWLSMLVFFIGILSTIVLSFYIRHIFKWNTIIQQTVVERTQRLSEVNSLLFDTQEDLKAEQERTEELLKTRTEELRDTQLQLFQVEKMDTIGILSAGIAHEVKNPLAVIQLGIDYLQKSLKKGGDIDGVIQDMDHAIYRADSVINELVDFSAAKKLELERQDLNPVIEESLHLVKHELTKNNITVVKELSKDLPFVELDRNKFEQVLINLFMNSIHAMEGKGTLLIRTYAGDLKEEIKKHKLSRTGRHRLTNNVLVIEIEDTGSGIRSEDKNRVFDPFFTTKKAGMGTGLGLTVAENIIRLHNAFIDIKNRKERGVVVSMIFRAN